MKATYMIAALLFTAASALACEHHHPPAPKEPSGLTLNEGKRWPTEDASRKGMAGIRDLLAEEASSIKNGEVTAEKYARITKGVDQRVAEMFRDCKHSPGADQVFHRILSRIIVGNTRMKKGPNPERQAGAEEVFRALEDYPVYFDHPNWQPIEY
jgi:hypothetical protein